MSAVVNEVVFALSGPQADVFASEARFRVLIAGRRFGKTHLAGVALLESGLAHPDSDNWYTAPTFKNAKRVAWRKFKKIIPRAYIAHKNETDLFMELYNGSRITLVGREEPDNLRGDGVKRMVNDEFCVNEAGDRGRETWEEVLLPMLADTDGNALFISTPRGYNWGYDLYQRGQHPEEAEWKSWQFTTLQGGRVPAGIIEEFRRSMDPRSFAQEFEASFQKLANRVYDYFDGRPGGNVDPAVMDTGAELLVGMDFNIDPMTYVIAVKVADECHVLDAVELPVSNTEEVVTDIRQRYPGRRVVVCPDPAGKSRQTSAAAGETDFTILRRGGFQVRAPNAAPLVIDRIANTQSNILSAEGRRRLRVHPRAKALIRALDGLTYKRDTSGQAARVPDKASNLIHITDALGYLLWQEFNLVQDRRMVQRPFM